MSLTPQVDFKEANVHVPRYRNAITYLNNNQAGLVQFQATSSTRLEFRISAGGTFNPARSYLTYQMTVPATASQYNVFHENGCDFRYVYFGDGAGAGIVDLSQADYWVNLARPFMTKKCEFDNRDRLSGFYPSHQPAANNILPYPKDGLTTSVDNGANLDYVEQQYLTISPQVNQTMAITRYLPLSMFVGTALAMDKDMIFGTDMFLRFDTQYLQKMFFTTTTPNAPYQTYTLPTAAITVSNMYLMLATEQNLNITGDIQAGWRSGKIKYTIPWVFPNRIPIAGANATASTNLTLQRNYGRAVKRIVTSLYQGNEFTPNWLDHSNYNGTKATNVYSNLNGAPLMNYALNCYNPYSSINPAGTNINTVTYVSDDYREMKNFFDRSAIQNYAIYQNNWFWLDSWGTPQQSLEPYNLDESQLNDGFDLTSGANQLYAITMNCPFNAQSTSNTYSNGLLLFCFVQYIRTLHVGAVNFTLGD